MTSKRSILKEDTCFRILRLIQDNPEMSQRQMAKATGVSTGGVNYVLKALIKRGFVKLENFTAARDKRRYAYILTPKGFTKKASLTHQFLRRQMEEFEALKTEISTLQNETMNDDIRGKE